MKRLLLSIGIPFVIASQIAACGPKTPSQRKFLVEPELEPFVLSFESETGLTVDNIDIVFEPIELPAVGMCVIFYQDGYKQKTIKVDPTYWFDEATLEEEKMGIIYHELGHCLLGRDHLETTFDYEYSPHRTVRAPSSLMYPSSFYSKFYEPLRQYYIDELINPERGQ